MPKLTGVLEQKSPVGLSSGQLSNTKTAAFNNALNLAESLEQRSKICRFQGHLLGGGSPSDKDLSQPRSKAK